MNSKRKKKKKMRKKNTFSDGESGSKDGGSKRKMEAQNEKNKIIKHR